MMKGNSGLFSAYGAWGGMVALLMVFHLVPPVFSQDAVGGPKAEVVFRPFVEKRPIFPRNIFASDTGAFDPGWKVPENAADGREDFELVVEGRIDVPGFDHNDYFLGLVYPFLQIKALKTVKSASDTESIGLTSTPGGFGVVEVAEREVLFDKIQKIEAPRIQGVWWIHHVAIKSDILQESKVVESARTPKLFRALIDTLFFTYRNSHWLEIRDASVSEFPDRIEYRLRGMSHQGSHSFYRKEGGMGVVPAMDYRLDFLFTLNKGSGEIILKPSLIDGSGTEHTPSKLINLSTGHLDD